MKKYLLFLTALVLVSGTSALITTRSATTSLSASVSNIFISRSTKTGTGPAVPNPKVPNPTCLQVQNYPIPASGWPAGSTAPTGGFIILNMIHLYAPSDCRIKITNVSIAVQTSGPQPSSMIQNVMLTDGIAGASSLANGITHPNSVTSFPLANGGVTLNPLEGTWIVTSASLIGGSGESLRVGVIGISGYYPSTNKPFHLSQSQWGSWIAVQ
jgi:hypothetical protein